MNGNPPSRASAWLIALLMLATVDLGFIQGSRNWPTIQTGPARLGLILMTISIANVVIGTGCALLIEGRRPVPAAFSSALAALDLSRDFKAGEEAGPADRAGLGLKVLVVEGNPVGRRVILRHLERLGCSAEAVAEGALAVPSREKGGLDVILMDVDSPGVEGWPAALEIRRVESELGLPRIPIVAMSSTEVDRWPTRDVGIDGHILKPVSRDHLFETLSHWAGPGAGRPSAETSIFDFDSLLVRCSDDRTLVVELIGTFLAISAEAMENMGRAIEGDDTHRLKVEAHGLAGSARTIGANALAGHCLTLETTATLENIDAARTILSRAKLEWDTLRPILELRLGETS